MVSQWNGRENLHGALRAAESSGEACSVAVESGRRRGRTQRRRAQRQRAWRSLKQRLFPIAPPPGLDVLGVPGEEAKWEGDSGFVILDETDEMPALMNWSGLERTAPKVDVFLSEARRSHDTGMELPVILPKKKFFCAAFAHGRHWHHRKRWQGWCGCRSVCGSVAPSGHATPRERTLVDAERSLLVQATAKTCAKWNLFDSEDENDADEEEDEAELRAKEVVWDFTTWLLDQEEAPLVWEEVRFKVEACLDLLTEAGWKKTLIHTAWAQLLSRR